jgi:hypothetical protein
MHARNGMCRRGAGAGGGAARADWDAERAGREGTSSLALIHHTTASPTPHARSAARHTESATYTPHRLTHLLQDELRVRVHLGGQHEVDGQLLALQRVGVPATANPPHCQTHTHTQSRRAHSHTPTPHTHTQTNKQTRKQNTQTTSKQTNNTHKQTIRTNQTTKKQRSKEENK